MRVMAGLVAMILGLMAVTAHAHGPTRQKVEESTVIQADPDTVWKTVANWGDLSWMPAVESVTAMGDQPGATRVLTLKSGKTLTEELKSIDAEGRELKYKITEGTPEALPVNNYSAGISVEPAPEGGSLVTYKGAFYRGFMNNNPPPELNDEAAVKAVSSLYKEALAGLKAKIEGK